MEHPCKQNCQERHWPSCRKECQKYQAWEQMKEVQRKEKERLSLLNGYTIDSCRKAKKGARRHDGRYIR